MHGLDVILVLLAPSIISTCTLPRDRAGASQGRQRNSLHAAAAAPGVRPGAQSAVAGTPTDAGARNGAADPADANSAGSGGTIIREDDPGAEVGPGDEGGDPGARVGAEDEGGDLPDVVFDGGYRIPGDIYARLFDYQKTGAGAA